MTARVAAERRPPFGLHFPDGAKGRPFRAGRFARPLAPQEPHERIVLGIDDPFLHGDYPVVGDLYVLRANFGAALGDIALAEALRVLHPPLPAEGVVGVYVQFGVTDYNRGPARPPVFLAISDHC